MHKHHFPAVVLTGLTIVGLLVDRVVAATTGDATFITDDARGSSVQVLAANLLLGLTFLASAWVVHRERWRFARARRAAQLSRPVLTSGLVLVGLGVLAAQPMRTLLGGPESLASRVSSLLALVAITAVVVSSLALGLALLGRNPLGIGGAILAALAPAMVLTAVLAMAAPALASPIYCTAVVLAGTALLGVRAAPATAVPHGSTAAAPVAG